MRILILAVFFAPTIAIADSYSDEWNDSVDKQIPAPIYAVPVQPVLPVPQDNGPWGTGYSVVTTTRPKQNLWDRDLTGSETVQRVVPNDALGQPIRGLDLTVLGE